jgi:hypothetical protein
MDLQLQDAPKSTMAIDILPKLLNNVMRFDLGAPVANATPRSLLSSIFRKTLQTQTHHPIPEIDSFIFR